MSIAARIKEAVTKSCSAVFQDDSFMWLCDVAVLYVISTPFFGIKAQELAGEGRL